MGVAFAVGVVGFPISLRLLGTNKDMDIQKTFEKIAAIFQVQVTSATLSQKSIEKDSPREFDAVTDEQLDREEVIRDQRFYPEAPESIPLLKRKRIFS